MTVQVDFVKNDQTSAYLTFSLQDALISSYSVSGRSRNTASETLTLNFTKLTYDTHGAGVDASDHVKGPVKAANVNRTR